MDKIIPEIMYIIPVADGSPHEASLLQGFAPSLIENSHLVQLINSLPRDIFELTPEGHNARIPRRVAGQAQIIWRGQSPNALSQMPIPPIFPFTVVFIGLNQEIDAYKEWIDLHTFPITVISEKGGTISYKDFSIEALKDKFLGICDSLHGQVDADSISEARGLLKSWLPIADRDLGYQVGGHGSITPNCHALTACGFKNIISGEFDSINSGNAPYVEIIARTTQSILDERERVGIRDVNRYFRPTPSLNLFAPRIYPHIDELNLSAAPVDNKEKRRFYAVRRALKRQDGYNHEVKTKSQASAVFGFVEGDNPSPHPLMVLRARELKLATECVGTLAASEISAVIRLPNAVNRTAGQVRQFAQHYNAKSTTDRKRREAFNKVQRAVTEAVPQEFMTFIENAEDGIRLISDAHLEWISVRGLPLCVQKNITRIPVTPGNLFIEQTLSKPYVNIQPSEFQEILILSALREDDPISPYFEVALKTFAPLHKDKIKIRTVRVKNKADIIAALNSYNGAMLIFDGHGQHERGKEAKLQLIDEKIDVWQLYADKPRIPPIVILSACDTHAADRNHASTANGFLNLGAQTVLGSVFPIDARDAASFAARLLYRISHYVPSAHSALGRSLTWMEVMSGMIKMQLLTDFCRHLLKKKLIGDEAYNELHLVGSTAISSAAKWPFEAVIDDLVIRGIEEKRAWHELRSALSKSTAISYIQMGRPETIIIHPDDDR